MSEDLRERSTRSLVSRRASRAVAGAVALAVLGSGAAACSIPFRGTKTKHFSADFDRAIGVYKNSDVRVLGVKIGKVDKITNEGDHVRLDMEYDASYKIPAGAEAALVAPSIVSDRYVQMTPVYESGATLANNTHLGTDRTESPIELDQIYGNIDNLDKVLGPEGANKNGALADLINVTAKNLNGNGAALHDTLGGLANAVTTLADNRTDLFSTIANLQAFTGVLAERSSDNTVRTFSSNLAQVSAQLDGERGDLAAAINQLGSSLSEVASFVRENRTNLAANVNELATVTNFLTHQKRALKEFIDTAPVALGNLNLAYNPTSGTLDTRDDSTSEGGLPGLLCNVLSATGTTTPTACQTLLGGPLGNVPKSSAKNQRSSTTSSSSVTAATSSTRDQALPSVSAAQRIFVGGVLGGTS